MKDVMLEYTLKISTTKIKYNNDNFNRLTILNYKANNLTYLVQTLLNYLLKYFSGINHLEKFATQELLTASLQWIRNKPHRHKIIQFILKRKLV
jgi:hypothetical protein